MKLTIACIGLLITVAVGQARASEGTLHRARASDTDIALNRSFETCAKEFLTQIFPGQNFENLKLSTKLIRDKQNNDAVWGKVKFKVQARLKGERHAMSEASCTVDSRDTQLVKMVVEYAPSPAKLAGLTPKDVRLAVAQ